MPTKEEVTKCLFDRMRQDEQVAARMEQAGEAMWREVPFQFYYGHEDNTINIVVTDAEGTAIGPLDLPNDVWKALLDGIGPATVVKKGINSMWLASFSAQ